MYGGSVQTYLTHRILVTWENYFLGFEDGNFQPENRFKKTEFFCSRMFISMETNIFSGHQSIIRVVFYIDYDAAIEKIFGDIFQDEKLNFQDF